MEGNKENPASPKLSPVKINECLHYLFSFILQSSPHQALGYPSSFSSALLQHDDDGDDDVGAHNAHDHDFSKGVPSYPLYKHLAFALEQWIILGSFLQSENVQPICEDDIMKQNKDKWNELITQKGSQLVTMLKGINYEIHVQEPYFSQLKDGLKTVEGRCAVGDYNRIRAGDLILVNKCLILEVQDVHHYVSFVEMLETEGLQKVFPDVLTIEEGEQIYRKFYTKEKEQLNGVVAICVNLPASQPYSVLSDILSGLGCRGIQSLLGLKQTVGTIPEALPPPKSTLLSSFKSLHKPDLKGCALTNGARALTKHVIRCSSNYWGKIEGNDSTKNSLAMEVISRIMNHCVWMNVHIVPPYGAVFEIRVSEGYGARWSSDGTKILGTNRSLPPMPNNVLTPIQFPTVTYGNN